MLRGLLRNVLGYQDYTSPYEEITVDYPEESVGITLTAYEFGSTTPITDVYSNQTNIQVNVQVSPIPRGEGLSYVPGGCNTDTGSGCNYGSFDVYYGYYDGTSKILQKSMTGKSIQMDGTGLSDGFVLWGPKCPTCWVSVNYNGNRYAADTDANMNIDIICPTKITIDTPCPKAVVVGQVCEFTGHLCQKGVLEICDTGYDSSISNAKVYLEYLIDDTDWNNAQLVSETGTTDANGDYSINLTLHTPGVWRIRAYFKGEIV